MACQFSDFVAFPGHPSADMSAWEEQKKEILLHAAMKHENVVEVKDIVKEIPPTPPGQRANTQPMLIVRNQSDFGCSFAARALM